MKKAIESVNQEFGVPKALAIKASDLAIAAKAVADKKDLLAKVNKNKADAQVKNGEEYEDLVGKFVD